MCSATFDKLLVLLGPSLTFQDTRMRKSVPPEERLAVTLKGKRKLLPYFWYTLYSLYSFFLGTDKKFRLVTLHYSYTYCGWNTIFLALLIIPSISIFVQYFWPSFNFFLILVQRTIRNFYPHQCVHSSPSGCPATAAHNLSFARFSFQLCFSWHV